MLAIGLAIVIGSRLSDQAVAVLAGAACGVGLAAPLGIVLGLYVGMSRAKSQSTQAPTPPQIVVVPTSPSPSSNAPTLASMPPPMIPMPRSFTIIGEGDEE